ASTPPPARASAPPPAPVTAQAAAKAIADRLDALFDDATSRVDPASLGIPVLETTLTESPSAKEKAAAKVESKPSSVPPKPDSRPPAIATGDPRLDVETPTALFVKDIQR